MPKCRLYGVDRRESQEGPAIEPFGKMNLRRQVTFGTWLRGPGKLEGDFIVLDRARATEYDPMETTGLVFDLAALRRPTDALPFVRQYGLLFHGPHDHEEEFRESWSEWERSWGVLSFLLNVYVTLKKAVQGDVIAGHELRTNWAEVIQSQDDDAPPTDESFYLHVTNVLAAATISGLEKVEVGIAAAHGLAKDGKRLGGAGDFILTANPPNLLGYAYHQLAHIMNRGEPGSRCPECGRVFIIKDRRQRFCSPQCAQRGRYRRWKEKQA